MNNYILELNKIMAYINTKPLSEKRQILNFIEDQYDGMSLSRKALRFYREQKPDTFEKIMSGEI